MVSYIMISGVAVQVRMRDTNTDSAALNVCFSFLQLSHQKVKGIGIF